MCWSPLRPLFFLSTLAKVGELHAFAVNCLACVVVEPSLPAQVLSPEFVDQFGLAVLREKKPQGCLFPKIGGHPILKSTIPSWQKYLRGSLIYRQRLAHKVADITMDYRWALHPIPTVLCLFKSGQYPGDFHHSWMLYAELSMQNHS